MPKLPVVDMCEDKVVLPVAGRAEGVPPQESPVKPAWQRWDAYGIGCLIEGGVGSKRDNLNQVEVAFRKLLTLGAKDAEWHGHLNLARVFIEQGGSPGSSRRCGGDVAGGRATHRAEDYAHPQHPHAPRVRTAHGPPPG